MAVVPYKAVNWQDNEPVFTRKLNTMANNDQWLYENTPRMMYTAFEQKRTEGLKIASGILLCSPNPAGFQQHVVYFGSFFSESCTPVVVTGLMHQGEVRITFGVKGIGTQYVDHRGFEILGGAIPSNAYTWKAMTKQFWITWIAVGY